MLPRSATGILSRPKPANPRPERRPIKASTIAMDRSRIQTHVKPLIGKKPIRSLSAHDIEEMQADIAAGKLAQPRRALMGRRKQKRRAVESQPGEPALLPEASVWFGPSLSTQNGRG